MEVGVQLVDAKRLLKREQSQTQNLSINLKRFMEIVMIIHIQFMSVRIFQLLLHVQFMENLNKRQILILKGADVQNVFIIYQNPEMLG